MSISLLLLLPPVIAMCMFGYGPTYGFGEYVAISIRPSRIHARKYKCPSRKEAETVHSRPRPRYAQRNPITSIQLEGSRPCLVLNTERQVHKDPAATAMQVPKSRATLSMRSSSHFAATLALPSICRSRGAVSWVCNAVYEVSRS